MNKPTPKELLFAVSSLDKMTGPDRSIWYFNRFWLRIADQNGYAYPAAFPEDSDLAKAHNAAHAQLVADLKAMQ